MALSTGTKLEIASKRLDGKAYTNPGTPAASEEIASLVQLSSNAVFYDQPPQNSIVPTSPSTYTLVSASLGGKPIAEYIEFDLTSDFLNGNFPTTTATTPALLPTTDASAGSVYSYQHIFLAKLPTDYIASSNNPKKNTGFFTNGTFLTGSGFSLQLIPPSFGVLYTAKLYNGSTEIAANDPVDWNLDYSTGVVLVQDRTGTLAGSTVPTKLKAYLYIGDYTSTTISNLSSSLAALSSSVITGTGNAGTASAGFLITSSNDGLLYTQSGSNAKNSLIFRDADITTAANQPIGRIAFESLDSNTAGSNNSQAVRAFIEAVSEDAQPDAFLAFGTALSGSLPQERVRITASGSVGIGVTTPTNTLQVGGTGITTTNFTASGNSTIGGNQNITGNLTVGGTINSTTGGQLLSADNVGRQYSTNGGTTASLNTLTFRDTDSTSDVTQSIGRIAFESLDSNTAGSNNSQAVRAFIEAVSEDAQPDAFLAFGTALSGSLPQERVRITASGSVGIGVTAPVNTLEVGLGGITTTSLTSSGDVLINGDLEVTGGDIKTTTTIGNIFNAGATTINIGGAASTVNIGHTSGTGTTTVRNNLTVDGNLTVNGTTTVINTDNLLVEDRFIILASGSIASSPQDSGIVVQTTTGSSGIGSGSALFLNGTGVLTDGTSRWGLAQNIPHNATSVTPTDYMVTVSSSTAAPSNTLPPTYGSASAGYGNMHINTTDGEIWIYV